jgi:hypothetical protein
MVTVDAVARKPDNRPADHEALRGRGRAPSDPTGCPESYHIGQGGTVLCTRDDGHAGHHMHANEASLITAEWWFTARDE